jgi:hypothetical protein
MDGNIDIDIDIAGCVVPMRSGPFWRLGSIDISQWPFVFLTDSDRAVSTVAPLGGDREMFAPRHYSNIY